MLAHSLVNNFINIRPTEGHIEMLNPFLNHFIILLIIRQGQHLSGNGLVSTVDLKVTDPFKVRQAKGVLTHQWHTHGGVIEIPLRTPKHILFKLIGICGWD